MLVRNIVKMLLVGAIMLPLAVQASWTIDADGKGFVGKGDLQQIYSWNNQALQNNANDVQFRVMTGTFTEWSWTCNSAGGDETQQRANTTTTTTTDVVESISRERSQISGVKLLGWNVESQQTIVESNGPPIGSCPPSWTAHDFLETVSSPLPGLLEVSIDKLIWITLPLPSHRK